MRSVAYSLLLQRAAEATGRVFTDLSVTDAGLLKGFFNTRLREAWEKWLWPDLMLDEMRNFRPTWAGSANGPADEYFYADANKYYQALKASFLQPPALAPNYVENSAFWAELTSSYSADTWIATSAYAPGAKVYYPFRQSFYQCHTAVPAGGGGILPTDTTNWGPLNPFERYVAYQQLNKTELGDVIAVYDKDPRIFLDARPLGWTEGVKGIDVYEPTVNTVWVHWRQKCPILRGATFNAAAIYDPGEQVYFSVTSSGGTINADFYDCLATTAAGESPGTTPAKWSKVALPYAFAEWLIHAAAADLLSKDGHDDWSGDEMTLATGALTAELDKQERQKGQVPPFEVGLRKSVYR